MENVFQLILLLAKLAVLLVEHVERKRQAANKKASLVEKIIFFIKKG